MTLPPPGEGSSPRPGLTPPPPPPPELPSFLPVDHGEWREAMLRPGMAAAMIYVLYLPILRLSQGDYTTLDQARRDFSTWHRLSFPEREALVAMFQWVEQQVAAPPGISALPPDLRGLLLAAFDNYDSALIPEET